MGIKIKFASRIASLQEQVKKAKQRALVEYGRGELQDVQRRIMVAKTDPYAKRWAPWSFATMRQRQRDGTATRGLLLRTGRLMRSFVVTIRGDSIKLSSGLDYAGYLQEGRSNMPARKIVDLSSKLSFNRMTKIFNKHLGQIK